MTSITKILVAIVISVALAVGAYYGIQKVRNNTNPACSGNVPVFIPTNGGELLLGKLNRTQTISTKHVLTLIGIPVPGCNLVSSITLPAETSYKVKLEKQWEVRIREGEREFVVIAPRVTPLLPVAFDTEKIKKITSGCIFLSGQATLNELEKAVSAELKKYAESDGYINMVRNSGRVVVAEFVKNWLVKQKQYEHAATYTIKVYFEGEPIVYY